MSSFAEAMAQCLFLNKDTCKSMIIQVCSGRGQKSVNEIVVFFFAREIREAVRQRRYRKTQECPGEGKSQTCKGRGVQKGA